MTQGPPSASDPQSPPRDIPAMPDPNRVRPEPAEGEELHWPDVPINELDDGEREALLQQAGPVGEQARLAWNAYQAENPEGDDPAAVAKERQRLTELGQVPPEDAGALREQAPSGPPQATPSTAAADASAGGGGDTGSASERADAEKKAAKRGLEIRDYGTEGQWRVYDAKTGRMVSRAVLDEPA